jgi:hypothetical protein
VGPGGPPPKGGGGGGGVAAMEAMLMRISFSCEGASCMEMCMMLVVCWCKLTQR